MTTLDCVLDAFRVDPAGIVAKGRPMPIEIPNVGRQNLGPLFRACGFERGAEIGVEQGVFAAALCAAHPHLRLWAIDAWATYGDYRPHVTQSTLNAFYAIATARLAPYRCTLVRKFSVDAAKDFPDGHLDFVYIDANHDFPHVVADLAAWVPKVRAGGIVAGHDYCRRTNSGSPVQVVEAVTGWTAAYDVRPWFVLGTKDCRPDEIRDRPRSFLWVKP